MEFEELNEKQVKAVMQTEGPVLVLAGAGSGKTRVLTHRVAHLVQKGISPYHMLAITFTNKAANEMRNRIEKLVGEKASRMWICTFHSMCARILRMDIDKIGYRTNFTIYDEQDSVSLIKKILKEKNIDKDMMSPKAAKYKVSDAKNAGISPEQYEEKHPMEMYADTVADIFSEYESRLKQENALDFDDLLLKTLSLFKTSEETLKYYGNKFKYILVDEYQDTNIVQYRLVKLLAKFYGNLFVVGDDDQSIYGWRGADIRNILEFEKDFKGTKVIRLEQNYRSHQMILDAANSVIKNNLSRKGKTLFSTVKAGEKPEVYFAKSEYAEADFIAQKIGELRREGFEAGQIAVLYRVNAQTRVLEDNLLKNGVAYRIYGGRAFYERKEIKDILAYLNMLSNPASDVCFLRVVNEPKRGIGQTTVSRISGYAQKNDLSVYEAAKAADKYLSARAARAVKSFIDLLRILDEKKDSMPVSGLVETLLEKSGYLRALEQENTAEAARRVENIEQFLIGAAEYDAGEDTSLEGFLADVSLMTDLDGLSEKPETVSLMTLHSAKGLEFPAVFIAGLDEGMMPHIMAKDRGMEEERRLMYVGMTRAKKRLILTCPESRMIYKRSGRAGTPYDVVPTRPSRFLEEIPDKMVKVLSSKREKERYFERFASKTPSFNAKTSFKPDFANHAVESPGRFVNGMKVAHPKFGEGVIMDTKGTGNEKIAVVDFTGHGRKKMFVAFAPLTILD